MKQSWIFKTVFCTHQTRDYRICWFLKTLLKSSFILKTGISDFFKELQNEGAAPVSQTW